MKRDQLAKRLETRWRELYDAVQGLSEDALQEPGVVGHWSIRDVLAHVTTWEEEVLKALPIILDGGPLPHYSTLYGGIDAFNAQAHERKEGFTLEQVLNEVKENPPTPPILPGQRPGRSLRTGKPLPAAVASRHLRPLPRARQANPHLATSSLPLIP